MSETQTAPEEATPEPQAQDTWKVNKKSDPKNNAKKGKNKKDAKPEFVGPHGYQVPN